MFFFRKLELLKVFRENKRSTPTWNDYCTWKLVAGEMKAKICLHLESAPKHLKPISGPYELL